MKKLFEESELLEFRMFGEPSCDNCGSTKDPLDELGDGTLECVDCGYTGTRDEFNVDDDWTAPRYFANR